jgi:hypothetical protein
VLSLRELIEQGHGLTNAQARQLFAGWKVLDDSGREIAERCDEAERAAQAIINDLYWELTERCEALIAAHPSVLRRPF